MNDQAKPVIGITMGDAAGIGPEIVLKALADKDLLNTCRCVIIGDLARLQAVAAELGVNFEFTRIDSANFDIREGISVFDLANLPSVIETGIDSAVTGKASAEYIDAAVELWQNKKIDAICTAPISKKAIGLGGYNFPGHTEFLADRTNTERFAMSFFGGDLRVVLLSTHLSLRDAIEKVKTEALIELIRFSAAEFQKLLAKPIRLAVAGLNPHASEGGMFGTEEQTEIVPAIERCRDEFSIDVSGPYSPDTIFVRAARGEFDAVVALYHDQATIAVKSIAFGSAVNVTLGLPLIRTSVDHGTAYDIAGQGIADASSMKAAIALAADLVERSRNVVQI